VFYVNNFSNNKQLLTKSFFLWKTGPYGGPLKVKIHIPFLEATHKPLHWEKWRFGQKTIHIPSGFIWILILFDEASKYGNCENVEVMLGQTLNHSVESSVILRNVVTLLLNLIQLLGSWHINGIIHSPPSFILWGPEVIWGTSFTTLYCLQLFDKRYFEY
jgi:hypothetical protein